MAYLVTPGHNMSQRRSKKVIKLHQKTTYNTKKKQKTPGMTEKQKYKAITNY